MKDKGEANPRVGEPVVPGVGPGLPRALRLCGSGVDFFPGRGRGYLSLSLSLSLSLYIYIYIERDIDIERERDDYVYIYI